MSDGLQKQFILVSGGGSGIGRGIALRLAAEGASVTILGRRQQTLAETAELSAAAGHPLEYRVLDITDAAAVDTALAELAEAHGGRIDAVVNNAGLGGPNACSTEGEDRWSELLAVNLDGSFFLTRAALRAMPEGGRVVNMSSVLGKFGVPGYTGYCTAKHGIIGFTKALALELAPRNITVNAICPGWVETEMARAGMERLAEDVGVSYEEARATALAQVPLGRILQPDEIAGLVLWLLSSESSGMTGQAINFSGGSAMW